jgi:hypothetical protein
MSTANACCDEFSRRDLFVKTFAWAVPSPEAIAAMAEFAGTARIVEINAGRGLWAHLLQLAGANIIATDLVPPPDPFATVRQMSAVMAAQQYLDSSGVLMTCWPDYLQSYAADALTWALQHHRIAKVIYIGEDEDGCTGDGELHRILARDFTLIESVEIPQWFGIHDAVYLYSKN